MNDKIAAKGDANRLAAYRHLPPNHAQESNNPSSFVLIHKGRECAVDPRMICEIEVVEIRLDRRRSMAFPVTQQAPPQIRNGLQVVLDKRTDRQGVPRHSECSRGKRGAA